MLRRNGSFITRKLHIEIRIVIDIKSIPVYEKEGVKTAVSDVGGPSLVIEVYWRVYSADDLKIAQLKLIKLVLVVLIAELYMVAHFETLVRDAVRIDDTLIRVLRQSALN